MATVVLSNHKFPEDGQVSIPLPIPPEEYEHCMEMLEVLCIGHATRRDCMVDSIESDYPALERLEGEMINLDGTFRPISANAHAYLMATVSQAHEQAPEQQMAELEHEEPEEGFGTSQQM